MTIKKALIISLLAPVLAGCVGTGNSDNPLSRSAGWFNFLNGTDIRRSCGQDGVDRYRFVYNGRWGEQVRIYEITRLGRGRAPAQLETRVIGPDFINVLSSDDLLAPWRGRKSADALSPDDMARLDKALADSGFDQPAPRGLNLPSDGFYWVAVACRSGKVQFNAWLWPSPGFSALRFPAELVAHDRTGVALAPPYQGPTRIQATMGSARDRAARTQSIFDLEVGDNGIKGLPALF